MILKDTPHAWHTWRLSWWVATQYSPLLMLDNLSQGFAFVIVDACVRMLLERASGSKSLTFSRVLFRLMAVCRLWLCNLRSSKAEDISLDDCKGDKRQEWYEAVGRDALVAAWTEDTGDHLETLKDVNDQMQEIALQSQTLYAKYFGKLDGCEDKDLKREYLDEIHQESLGNDFKSEYPDRTHDESFGNKDSKLGPTLNPKQVREKKKKTRCKDNLH